MGFSPDFQIRINTLSKVEKLCFQLLHYILNLLSNHLNQYPGLLKYTISAIKNSKFTSCQPVALHWVTQMPHPTYPPFFHPLTYRKHPPHRLTCLTSPILALTYLTSSTHLKPLRSPKIHLFPLHLPFVLQKHVKMCKKITGFCNKKIR